MAYEVQEGFQEFNPLSQQHPDINHLHNSDEHARCDEIREIERYHRDGWQYGQKQDSETYQTRLPSQHGSSTALADTTRPRRASATVRFGHDGSSLETPSLPINVPIPYSPDGAERRGFEGVALHDERYHEPSLLESYFEHRRPSITFSPQVTLDTGQQYPLDQPIPKVPITTIRLRGRSLLQELAKGSQRPPLERAHSDNPYPNFDAATGEVLEPFPPAQPLSITSTKPSPIILHPIKTTADDLVPSSPDSNSEPASLPSLTSDDPTSLPSQPPASPRTPPTTTPMSVLLSPLNLYSPFKHPTSLDTTSAWPAPRPSSRRQFSSTRAASCTQTFSSPFSPQLSLSRTPSFRRRRTSTASQKRGSTSSSLASPATAYLSRFSPHTPAIAPADEPPTPAPNVDEEGAEIGDYILGRELGRGGFSRVLEAHTIDPTTQTSVTHAVKIVRRSIDRLSEAENETLQAQNEHEIEIWRCLSHRNVLPLLGIRIGDCATYAFMRYVQGGTLFNAVKETRKVGIGVDRARRLSRQIAEAVRYLHRDVRVAHRDLKLENCLLEREDGYDRNAKNGFLANRDGSDDGTDGSRGQHSERVLLCDFGLAQFLPGHDDDDDDSDDNRSRPCSPAPSSAPANGLPSPPPDDDTFPSLGSAHPSSSAPPPLPPSTTNRLPSSKPKTPAAVAGSLQYASPELLRSSEPGAASSPSSSSSSLSTAAAKLDLAAVDIWALGCVLYALVTGSLPFMHALPARVREMILEGAWDRDAVRAKEEEEEGMGGNARGGKGIKGMGMGMMGGDAEVSDQGLALGFAWGGRRGGEESGVRSGEGPCGRRRDGERAMGPIEELIDGCLKMDPRERWDIGRVVASRWLSGE